MLRRRFPSLRVVLFATLLLLAPGAGKAASITFIEDRAGGPVTVLMAGFDRDPVVSLGSCFGTGADPNKCANAGDNGYGLWDAGISYASPRSGLAFLTDPLTGAVSAMISLYWGADGIGYMNMYFQADPIDYPLVPDGYLSFVETGMLQDVTSLFSEGNGVGDLAPPGLTVYVQTDATPVPEPASLLLLGAGLLGSALARRSPLPRRAESR